MLTEKKGQMEYPMRGRPPEQMEPLPAEFLDLPAAYEKERNNHLEGWLRSGWLHSETHSVTARMFPA